MLSSCPQHGQGAVQGSVPNCSRGCSLMWLQNRLLKVMQCFPCHLGAPKITPCPSLSACPCCCSAGLEQWGLRDLSPGVLSGRKAEDVCWDGGRWGVCAGFVEAASGNHLRLQGRALHGGKLISKQITLPCSSCRQLCGSRAITAPCHEPSIAQPQTSRVAASPHQGLAGSWKNLSGFNRLWSKAPGRELTCSG